MHYLLIEEKAWTELVAHTKRMADKATVFAVLGRMDRQQRRMSVTRHIQTDLAILPGKRKDSLYEHREEMLL